ncbi:MAG: response regulator [Nitrospirota bacterium]
MYFRILAVDDDPLALELLEGVLSRKGCTVDAAASGTEAMRLLERERYDVVFTDLKMPYVSGIEVLKSARQHDSEVLVVVCTGYSSLESAIESIRAGAYDYLTKPFTADEILVVLKNALEKIQLKRKNARLLEKMEGILTELKARGGIDSRALVRLPSPGGFQGQRQPEDKEEKKAEYLGSLKELKDLAQLKREGLISSQEFKQLKGKLLGQ